MFMLFSLLLTTLVSSECVDLPNWGCELVEKPEYCNGLQLKKCPKACAQCTEEPATEAPPTPTEAPPTPTEAECEDLPNWGCELVEKPEYCNGLQLKKCPKACAQCGGEESKEESKEEEDCTETFEPVCTACQLFEDCQGMTYKIEYRGEGQSGKFGCTYPKSYEYVNSGDGCPECADVTCDYKISEGKFEDADAVQTGCYGTLSHVEGTDDDFEYKVEKDVVTVLKHPNPKFVGAVGEYSEADGVKTIQWGEDGPTYTCGGEEEKPSVSCEGLDCAACLAVPDYGCGFADGACYTAGMEPMDATSFAFTTADCPKEVSCDGLDCAACLAVPDYGCGFADGTCYTAGMEPMDATSFAFTTDDCPKEVSCDGLDCAGCLAVPEYACGFADGTCYKAGMEPMDATSFAFTTDDCPKEESAESGEPEECSNEGGDEFCAGFADYCEGVDNQNVRDKCAKMCGVCTPTEAPKLCCKAMTASCLACSQGTSEEEYCGQNPDTVGCPKPEPMPECDCGKDAVKGEEKFQSGSADGDKMCQFGANCATFFEGCDGKGAKVCSLKIEYVEELPECDCGKNAVKGEEKFQSGSADGDKMCQFGANCATFFEGCDGKGAKVCSLKIEYVEESEESPEPESEESEEPEVLCSMSDCLKPCRGRRKKRQCQVAKNSKCADKKGRGRKKNRKFFSKLACQSKAQVFMTEPAAQTAWTAEDALVYGFALVGLVALGKGALAVGRKLQGEEYRLVGGDNSEL